jgi:hypothetical protein
LEGESFIWAVFNFFLAFLCHFVSLRETFFHLRKIPAKTQSGKVAKKPLSFAWVVKT